MTAQQLVLDVEASQSDDRAYIAALRGPGTLDYIDPELERLVADAIRQYPVWGAPQWLSPVAAILIVEEWLTRGVRP